MTSPNFEYVRMAVAVMQWARSDEDLVQWWKDEKPHREKWRLSPTHEPGLSLLEAFKKRRSQLKDTENENL